MTTRPGRRVDGSDTRAAIAESAGRLFAAHGFDRTTLRAIAGDAGVDVALIAHYFGGKRALYDEVTAFPVDPRVVLAVVDDVADDALGATVVRTVVSLWDGPNGPAIVARVRSLLTGPAPQLVPAALLPVVRERIGSRLAPYGDVDRRLSLVFSQIAGLFVTRTLFGLDPLARATPEEAAAWVGPTVQRYLTGPLDSPQS